MNRLQHQIFFDLLHSARRLKKVGWMKWDRRAYLLGMLRLFCLHRDDLELADIRKKYYNLEVK